MGHYSDLYEAQERLEQQKLARKLQDARRELEGEVRELSAIPKGNPKARDIAIAITHIETAILWLKR